MFACKKDASQRLFLCPGKGSAAGSWTRLYATESQRLWCGKHPIKISTLPLIAALFIISNPIYAEIKADQACPAIAYDETTTVSYIHDGDTLHLEDGRKVRLIGINTPEVAYGTRAAEQYSKEAKNSLINLFKNDKTISLVFGEDKQDRYKRLLAHGFNSDGTNIQAALLNKGNAYAISFPPNTRYSTCYQTQEREARCNKFGLWKKTKPLKAKTLDDTDIGFKLVKGKVSNININKKGIWISLNEVLTIGIRPDNLHLFDIDEIYPLLNKTVVVRGWLGKNKNKKYDPYYIRIRHPSSLQLADSYSCK